MIWSLSYLYVMCTVRNLLTKFGLIVLKNDTSAKEYCTVANFAFLQLHHPLLISMCEHSIKIRTLYIRYSKA